MLATSDIIIQMPDDVEIEEFSQCLTGRESSGNPSPGYSVSRRVIVDHKQTRQEAGKLPRSMSSHEMSEM